MGGLVCPIDKGQETLPGPPPPHGRQIEWLHLLPHPFPPKIPQGCQGRSRLSDLLHGIVPVRQLMAFSQGFDGLNCRVHSALDLRGCLGRRVRDTERLQRARERLQGLSRRPLHLFPSLHLGALRFHLRLDRWTVTQISPEILRYLTVRNNYNMAY